MTGYANLTTAQMRAILKERSNAEKLAKAAAEELNRATYAEVSQPLFDAIVTAEEYVDRETNTWAGFSARGIPFEVDGQHYTMSVTLTHVERKAEKEAAVQAEFLAMQAADAAKVSAES